MSAAPLATAGPPHGVHLMAYAALSADIAEGDRPAGEVASAHGLTEAQWLEVTAFWSDRMMSDAQVFGADARVPRLFSEAFSAAQDRKSRPPALDVEGWAALTEEMSYAPERALGVRRLSTADYARAARHWARELATSPELASRFEAARRAHEHA